MVEVVGSWLRSCCWTDLIVDRLALAHRGYHKCHLSMRGLIVMRDTQNFNNFTSQL